MIKNKTHRLHFWGMLIRAICLSWLSATAVMLIPSTHMAVSIYMNENTVSNPLDALWGAPITAAMCTVLSLPAIMIGVFICSKLLMNTHVKKWHFPIVAGTTAAINALFLLIVFDGIGLWRGVTPIFSISGLITGWLLWRQKDFYHVPLSNFVTNSEKK